MRKRQLQRKMVFAAGVQLLALLVLQSYFLVPLCSQFLVSAPHGASCQHDHRLCGCSPERSASRTCCCFQSKPKCCQGKETPAAEALAKPDQRPGRPILCAIPCGSQPKLVLTSLQEIKFLQFASVPLTAQVSVTNYPALVPGTSPRRFLDPPDPPPKIDRSFSHSLA
jgi:hypothetical protein